MLYVFHVDTGRMIKFDMNVALSSVQNLKDMIERLHGLPAANIVLLVSGGEMLTPGSLVCSYSAGTDTNPIYMFSTVDVKPQPWPSIEPDVDLKDQVDRCLTLPATYSTVVTRAQLAQQIYDLAHEEEAICERLVHEQHLQQQGWSAVIANMEDLTDEFRRRFENFRKCFEEHLRKRNEYLKLLGQFNDDLDKLARIPILPGLMQNAEEEFHGFDDYLNNDEVFSRSQYNVSVIAVTPKSQNLQLKTNESSNDNEKIKNNDNSNNEIISIAEQQTIATKIRTLTLLQWISAKENHNTLKIMAEECTQGLSTFDDDKFEKLKQEVLNIIRIAEQEEIKEIKGLEDRLCGLEKLMYELRKLVQEQKELSTAFQQNQNRASNLGDASILPDLCASHRSQLLVMLQNQKVIRDIRRRISRAKDELGANLEKRLKFIVHIENSMSELDNNLLFYHRCLRRVERHLNIIQQIHQTPSIYVAAVTEVVRRRIFSKEFINWASNLACDFYTIHNEEVLRRQEFNVNFEGHFLNALFPGMQDIPPAFANETPFIFDASLPNITKNDLDFLSSYLPDIASKIQFPDMGPVIEFFVSRSGTKSGENKSSITNKSQSNTQPAITHRPIDLHAHLKDGFESETDTEEFEKVGQSSNEQQQSTQQVKMTATIATSTSENVQQMITTSTSMEIVTTKSVETLTEENLGSTRLEVEQLENVLKNMSKISNESIALLKSDLKLVHNNVIEEKNQMNEIIKEFTIAWKILKDKYDSYLNDTINTLKNAHKLELNDINTKLTTKLNDIEIECNNKNLIIASQKETIINLENELTKLHNDIINLTKKIDNLQDTINLADIEKEKALNECRERLIHEHKTEIESLRCRFKLMTSMERSPSDTSLEKIEKPDMIEISCHESILLQARENMNNEKELAIKEAVELERLKWMSGYGGGNNSGTIADDGGIINQITPNVDLLKKIIEEKDKQLDAMRERDTILSKENSQLKIKIESLTNEDESDKIWLKERLEYLNKDKTRLEQELNMEKSRRLEMESSIATMKSSTIVRDVIGSPDLSGTRSTKMSSSQTVLKQQLLQQQQQQQQGITIDSCNKDDIVFIVWNAKHGQFMVVQDSPNLYFVHGDSLSALNIKLPNPSDTNDTPIPLYCIVKVVDKEYCQARKDENRYKVTKGTKFYRVKLQPYARMETSRLHRRDRYASSSSSASVSRSTSTQHLIDSFAQTDSSSSVIHSSPPRDTVDSATGAISTITVPSAVIQERTMSVCSVAEEEDEPISLLGERCHYTSLSEEDEKECTTLTTTVTSCVSSSSSTTTLITSTTSINQQQQQQQLQPQQTIGIMTTTKSTESSLEKDQDDSDEYRSLEAKDESDFTTAV